MLVIFDRKPGDFDQNKNKFNLSLLGITFKVHSTHLCSPLLVRVLMLHAVYLQAMRLQRTPLRERLLAQIALVRPNAGVGARVPLQVERVVESFATKSAQIPFDVRVALHVPIEQPLQRERLRADVAGEFVRVIVGDRHRRLLVVVVGSATAAAAQHMVERQRVLEAVATVDELQLDFGGQAQLEDTKCVLGHSCSLKFTTLIEVLEHFKFNLQIFCF